MKNLYKKIIPLFGASCCFLPSKHNEVVNSIEKSELVTVIAKLSKIAQDKKNLDSINNKQLQEFIEELNKNEIYILVTDTTQKKLDQNILLLLHTEDRLNAEQSLIDSRQFDILFKTTTKEYKTKYKKFVGSNLLKANLRPSITKLLRNGKSYYVDNLGGYKSICPVFFDKAFAEEFLIQTSKDGLNLLRTFPLDGNKEILKGFLNTKIISLGLGDFIEHYSQENNKKYLEKVEFLFVPSLKKENRIQKKLNTKSFKTYQKHYFDLKKI